MIAVKGLLNYKALFSSSWKYLLSGVVMFIPVFWMNTHLKGSWLMMGLEVLVGIVIYSLMVFILRAQIIDQAKKLILDRLGR